MLADMRNTWDSETSKPEGNDLFGDAQNSELLGQILERSSSAPPLPSETNADIGGLRYNDTEESFLFGNARRRSPTSRLGLVDDSGRDTAPIRSDDAGYIPRYTETTGRSTAPGIFSASAFDEPLFGGRATGSLIEDDAPASDEAFLFQRQHREGIPRSHSAAPLLRESKSLGPPPGYAMSSGTNESYDKNVSAAIPRSASTGVIGGQQKTSSTVLRTLGLDSDGTDLGTVRPAPKTLMDLIQEDFPSSPSPMYKREQQDGSYGKEYVSHSQARTASPPPPRYNRVDDDRHRMEKQQQERVAYTQQERLGEISHSMDQMRIRDEYSREQLSTGRPYVSPSQSFETPLRSREYMQGPRAQHAAFVPAERAQLAQPSPQHVGQYYQSQPVYYSDQQSRNVAQMNVASSTVQAQLIPSGHTVYVNAPPSYGYSTPQYHPRTVPQQQQQQPRIVHHPHQSMPGGHRAQEQFISVLPIQEGGQVSHVSNSGGYTYWPPDVSSPSAPSVPQSTYPHSGGTSSSIARPPMESPISGVSRRPRGGRSPNERGGKTRRGGGTRRGGANAPKHPTGASTISPLLEEFRASKSRDWSIIDIKGHIVEFCQDQNGSRFIQQRLEVGDMKEKQIVVSEVLPEVHHLRNDVFGNYVVQKLLEFGTPQMKADLRDTLKGEMLALSLQMYGCRVVQKALEMLDEDDLPRLLLEFHHNVLSCIQDQNGNHVIQKCVEVASAKAKDALAAGDEAKAQYFSEQIDFIIDDVLANVESLSCHPYGCRVLQRILEHCVEPKKTRTLDEIAMCHKQLLDDQYGNYVIQHVLQYGRHSDRDSILNIVVQSGLLALSKQKFASNVVEKLLKYGSPGLRNAIVREMLKEVDEHSFVPLESGGTSVVLLMVRDAYANYVVQTALDVVPEGEEKRMLLEELSSHSAQLRNYTFAKHIVTKLGA